MIELFKDIEPARKRIISTYIDSCFYEKEPKAIAEKIYSYRKMIKNEQEKQFIDFYFNMLLIGMKEIVSDEDYSN